MNAKSPHTLFVKNMVCPRCIVAVEGVLKTLGFKYKIVELGEVHLLHSLSNAEKASFRDDIQTLGFELISSSKSAIISKIKTLIIEQIHFNDNEEPLKLSTLLSQKLNHEYTYLSRLFSSVEGLTIEKYFTKQRIERTKELLKYDQMTLSEISIELNYSSVAHISAQFKKEIGMTPTEFKNRIKQPRTSLDNL